MFDTLKYSKILEAVGLSREQAEAHVKIYSEIVEEELITKSDFKTDILRLEQRLIYMQQEIEYRLIIKVGAMLAAGLGLTVAVLTLILKP